MAFVKWNQGTQIWEIAATPESPSTAWNHLPIQNPTEPLDTANKQYVDSKVAGGPFVPYVGAVANVNLGLFNLLAGRVSIGGNDVGYALTVHVNGQQGELSIQPHSNSSHYFSTNIANTGVITDHRFFTRNGTATDNLAVIIGGQLYTRILGSVFSDYDFYERLRSLPMGHWQTWTPAWKSYGGGADGIIGNGTINARYSIVGRTVFYYIEIAFSTTTVFPASYWAFTVPPAYPINSYNVNGTVTMATGGLYMNGLVIPASYHYGIPNSIGIECQTPASPSIALVSSGHPWTWASGHRLWISGTYESL